MSESSLGPSRALGRKLVAGAALALLTATMAGCASDTIVASAYPDLTQHDYRLRHPIMISNEPEVLVLPIGMRGPALSRSVERAIHTYLAGYRASGGGELAIQVPVNSANEIAAGETGRAVHYALVRAGVPRRNIRVAPYAVDDHAKAAAIRLAYLRVKPTTGTCGIWPDTDVRDEQNEDSYNFGCATQQNLAAMVANPEDLLVPRPMTPPDGNNRARVLSVYQTIGNVGWVPQPRNGLAVGPDSE